MQIAIPSSSEPVVAPEFTATVSWFTFFQNIFQELKTSPRVLTVGSSSDFPLSGQVQTSLSQCYVTATVTDNDSSRTNTGQTFNSGAYLIWNGTNWTNIGL